MKRYVVIAGVNGAGKSTFYSTEGLFDDIEKINLDETVREIGDWKNTSDVMRAGKIVIQKIKTFFDEEQSFSQETTLCGKSIINNIQRAKELGYYIELYYVGVDSVEIAKARVKYRVEHGGHGISDEDIERRYLESLNNVRSVLPLCNEASFFDNTTVFRRVAIYENNRCVRLSKSVPSWFKEIGLE